MSRKLLRDLFVAFVLIALILGSASCSMLQDIGDLATTGAPSSQSPAVSGTPVPSGTQTTGPALTAKDYFPFDADVYYKYAGTGNEYAPMDAYVDYVKDDSIQLSYDNGGTVTGKLYKYRDGAIILVRSVGEFYFREDLSQYDEDKSEVQLKEPIAVGTTWPVSDGEATITSISSAVTVPAGSYSAVEVTIQGSGVTTKMYYAQGVGFIKMETSGDYAITQELEQRDTNKPMTKTYRFYGPKMTDTDIEIVYKETPVELYTNTGMIEMLQKQFRSPLSQGLIPLMSANTKINSISVNNQDMTVHVDFSKEFISEMNAGSSTEGAILDSVTDTLCGIYGANGMVISIDGKAYESGHFALGVDDVLKPDFEKAKELK